MKNGRCKKEVCICYIYAEYTVSLKESKPIKLIKDKIKKIIKCKFINNMSIQRTINFI